MRCILVILTFVLSSLSGYSQVVINEISIADSWVELHNIGTTQVDVGPLRLCRRPIYTAISSLTILNGNTLLNPGDYVVVEWNQIGPSFNELGLYKPSGGFGSASNILDYVQYGGIASPTRAPTAVIAGVWDDANEFVPFPTSMTRTLQNFNPAAQSEMDTDSKHWWDGPSTQFAQNTCIDEYTFFNMTRISLNDDRTSDYETDGLLESDQIIEATAAVDYDSALEITLLAGFEVQAGADFHAVIDGCNAGMGGSQ